MEKECGKIEKDNEIGVGDYVTRFYDEYMKSDSLEFVMYYNDEVF